MPGSRELIRHTEIERSARVVQLEGLFDVPPSGRAERRWDVALPIEEREWNIGLIVGPSGSGKSTILAECFGLPKAHRWPKSGAVVDGFPESMGVKDVTEALSAVGFSSPPSWLRPYSTLSNGEQFRADLARVLVEGPEIAVVDEFTSVVDRTVAKVASAAAAKHIRRSGKKLVAGSCHYDIIDWLQPDWVFDTGGNGFSWRHLQRRPRIDLEIFRTTSATWAVFHHHHYLTAELHRSATCFVGLVEGRPAVFSAILPFPHPRVPNYWREHRTVCLPDFQGVGIGNAMSEFVGGLVRARGGRYLSTPASPSMIRHRARSPLWNMTRKPSRTTPQSKRNTTGSLVGGRATNRLTASFEYVGPPISAEQLAAVL